MAERSTVAQVSQIGKEVTPGTAVAATRRLGSLNFTPSTNAETDTFRAAGSKFASFVSLNREWTDIAYEGKPTYEEIVYPLASVFGTPVVSQLMDGGDPTGVYEWVFTPAISTADNPKTFTLQNGQAGVQAERYAHMLLTSFAMEVSRSEVNVSGVGFARSAETAITMTPGLTLHTDLTPMLPGQFGVRIAETTDSGDLDQNRTRVISVSPSMEDRYTPAWFVDNDVSSFATFVEGAEGIGGGTGLTVEANAEGMGFLQVLREGTTVLVEVSAVGPVLYDDGGPGVRASFVWLQTMEVSAADAKSDEDGIYAAAYTLTPVVNPDVAADTSRITVQNNVAAL